MKKHKNNQQRINIILITLGAIMIAFTLLIQPILISLLTQNCPLLGDVRECGLEIGYKNAFFAETLPVLWIIIGLVIFSTGIVRYIIVRKRR